jgi:hypothetical protein
MFEPLQNFIIPASNRFGISKELKASYMCKIFRDIVPLVFPNIPEIENHISPHSFNETYIVVNVSGPGFAQEIMMKKNEIIRTFNKKAGKNILKNLRTQIKNNIY